jgi:uncharacterized protein YraI
LVVGLFLLVLLSAAVVRGSVVSASGLWQGLGHRAGDAAVVVTATTDIRSGPGSEYLVLTSAHPGEQFSLLGKSVDTRWWRIDFGGQPAWIPAVSTRAQASALVSTVTIGGAGHRE